MTTYIITYDLADPENGEPQRDYSALEKAIQNYGAFCHLQKSVWMIVSEEANAPAIRDDLQQYMGKDDKLFIAKTAAPAAWSDNYDKRIPEWLKAFL